MNVSYFTDSAARDCGHDIGDGGQQGEEIMSRLCALFGHRVIVNRDSQPECGRCEQELSPPFRGRVVSILSGPSERELREIKGRWTDETPAEAEARRAGLVEHPLVVIAAMLLLVLVLAVFA